MWKLIIVDDEPKVRNGLKKIISWQSFGFSVEGLFENGVTALEYLNSHEVDLVLTDVKMPKMNGLELIEAIRRKGSATHILILSGFDDYKYLKQAIKYNVDSYILKPVHIEELCSNLQIISKQINQERNSNQLINEGLNAICNTVFQRLVQNGVPEQELRNKLKFLDLTEMLHWQSCCLGIVRLVDPQSRLFSQTSYEERQILAKLLRDVIDSVGGVVIIDREQLPIIIVENQSTLEKLIVNLAKKIEIKLKKPLICFGGIVVEELLEVHISYYSAYENMFKNRSSESSDFFISYMEAIETTGINEPSMIPIDGVEKAIHEGNAEELSSLLFAAISEKEDFTIVSKRFFSMVMYIVSSLQRTMNYSRSLYDELEIVPQDILALSTIVSLRAYCDALCTRFEELFSKMLYTGNPIVDDMIQYIYKEYSTGISLKDYAYQMKMNPVYLGKLFVDITGEKFTKYVQDFRIEQACRLLKNTCLKISDIALQTGFTDTHYFLKVFRSIKLCTPKEYRATGK